MDTARFRVIEHIIDACHIREYPRATANSSEDVLQIAVKQYVPKTQAPGDAGGITIIGANANGFPKELYEPLWDDLFDRLSTRNIHIRSVWISDAAHQGESSVLNEEKLGNDPSWADHPRDMFMMINHFRDHIKRPLVGIGHSFGGNNIVNLAHMHPRLFTTIVLLDPVFWRVTSIESGFKPIKLSAVRRDIWPSRELAEKAFRRSPFFHRWDSRVLDRWMKFGLRDLPTLVYPDKDNFDSRRPALTPKTPDHKDDIAQVPVTLKTTKHQEVFTFIRSLLTQDTSSDQRSQNHEAYLDMNSEDIPNLQFHNAYGPLTFARLPYIRPSVFYVFADESHLSLPILRADKLAHTGTGAGGSGGIKNGRVSSINLKKEGHLFPMENVHIAADAATTWIVPEIERWRNLEQKERQDWAQTPAQSRSQMSPLFLKEFAKDFVSELVETAEKKAKL